jgi:alpha-D-ribose 1-methylphosphonate 5-triphosphate diphosphatase
MQTLIKNANLVLPNKVVKGGWLLIENSHIVETGEVDNCPSGIEKEIDARDNFLLPGLIDLHCDAIEKLVEPRPNVQFDLRIALHEVDRRLASCGITTEFHAVSLDDNEFGTRSVEFMRDMAEVIQTDVFLVRHEVHARFEVTSQRGYEVVLDLIGRKAVRLVSLMDHTPGQGQYSSIEAFRDYVKRTVHMTDEQVDELLLHKSRQQELAPKRIEKVTQRVREAGLALATHDDDSAEKVERQIGLGVTMSEFPTTLEAAQKAHDLGLAVCMGAPNVLRGKSSGGNLSATEAIKAGVTNVLCADYYPASMLASLFKLYTQNIVDLPTATNMLSLNAAKAVKMDDKLGSLEAGKLADVIEVNLLGQYPRVQRVFVGGVERLTMVYHY